MAENLPNAESEIYQLHVKFWRGDSPETPYEDFKKTVRERIEGVLPMSMGTMEARLLMVKITKDDKE